MDKIPDADLPEYARRSRRIIGLAMKAHRMLGCGFVESIYREALAIELRAAGIVFEIHSVLPVFYAGEQIGIFQPDVVVEGQLIIELKAVEALTVPHSVQLINYLAAAKIEHGLLLNFGAKSLQFKTKTRSRPAEDDQADPPNLHS